MGDSNGKLFIEKYGCGDLVWKTKKTEIKVTTEHINKPLKEIICDDNDIEFFSVAVEELVQKILKDFNLTSELAESITNCIIDYFGIEATSGYSRIVDENNNDIYCTG